MKLLFHENLSPRLAGLRAEIYPGSTHVQDCDLSRASDTEVWQYAKAQGFTIVSKDSDSQEKSILWGSPPKVIWIRMPNCRTVEVAELLRAVQSSAGRFVERDEATCLVLGSLL